MQEHWIVLGPDFDGHPVSSERAAIRVDVDTDYLGANEVLSL